MNILLGANRVLKQNYLSFIPLKALKLPLRGLMRKFIKRYGPKSLITKRREPLTNGMIRALSSPPEGFNLGPLGKYASDSVSSQSWRAAITVAASSGFRKAELFQSNAETFYLTWNLIDWVISGVDDADPTDQQLLNLRSGDFAVVTPPPSKSDQFDTVWGVLPVYLPFGNESRNAAAALQQLTLAADSTFRSSSAANAVFIDNNKKALTCTAMASAIYHAMVTITGSQVTTKLYTWHSFRSYLATALYAARVKPATIQAMLRWQTEESLRTYMRLSRAEAAKHLNSAANAIVASINTTNVPLSEEFQLFVAMRQMVENI